MFARESIFNQKTSIMRKIILVCTLLIGLAISVPAQFIKDQSQVYLKSIGDKVGIGIAPTADKFTIASVSGETILGLRGFAYQIAPYITFYNSSGTALAKIFPISSGIAIGMSRDTTVATLVIKPDKSWIKANGTLSALKLQAPLGVFTTVTGKFYAADSTGIRITTRGGTVYGLFITTSGGVSAYVIN
jgi:hypothetical protein